MSCADGTLEDTGISGRVGGDNPSPHSDCSLRRRIPSPPSPPSCSALGLLLGSRQAKVQFASPPACVCGI